MSRARLIQIWFGVVALAIAGVIVMGVAITISTGILLLATSVIPPAIVLFMWHEAPPTVAEVIHAVDRRA